MSDEIQQPAPEPTQPEPIPAPLAENPISETNPVPASPQEPTTDASIPPGQSDLTEAIPNEVEAPQNPEDAIPVNNDISANEPLEPAPVPPVSTDPSNSNIAVEKHGNDVTITEIMNPTAHPQPATAQMAGNEPIGLAEEIKIKKRNENLKLANATRQEKKRKKIDAILDLFAKQTNPTNDKVEKLLHVSDATATRYLDELEKEGKIRQVGIGKHTHYKKI